MKIHHYLYKSILCIGIIAMTLVVQACAIAEVELEQTGQDEAIKKSRVAVKSPDDYSSEDMKSLISVSQSDPGALLYNQIIRKDGHYVLLLSRKEALQMGISEAVYIYFQGCVQAMNSQE